MDFTLEQKSSLKSDPTYVNVEVQQSTGPGSYYLDNTYGCDCGLEKARIEYNTTPFSMYLLSPFFISYYCIFAWHTF